MQSSRQFPAIPAACAALALFAACGGVEEPGEPEIRPVRTLTVEMVPAGQTVTLTGRIEAEKEVSLAFRVGQRMVERSVRVGDRVEPGRPIARLEATTFENAVQAARANLAAAQARAADARLEFERQQALFARQVASRAVFERAPTARDGTQAQVDAARA